MHPVHPSKPRNKSVPLANDAMLQILFQIDAKPCALVNLACNPCNFANRYIVEHKHKTWLTSQAKYSTSQTPPRVGFDPSNRNPLRPWLPAQGINPIYKFTRPFRSPVKPSAAYFTGQASKSSKHIVVFILVPYLLSSIS